MKKSCCAILAIALLAALPTLAAAQELGKPVTITTATPIKAILAEPEKYLGKEVVIQGKITQVCQMQGCWILVKDASSADSIMVKVDDGVIVFPKDGAGKTVTAQGKLEKVADEAQSEAGIKSPYRLKGSGAVVK